MEQNPKIKIIKPGPHRKRRIKRAVADPSVEVVVIEIDTTGGRVAAVPPAVSVRL